MHKLFFRLAIASIVFVSTCLTAQTNSSGPFEIISVKKIWDGGPHNAFTDLIRFEGKWLCTFREAESHVHGHGKIRVLTSTDGEKWESAALLSEENVDLRDPKLSLTPDNRLMMTLGSSLYEGDRLKERQSRVSFSTDGQKWTTAKTVGEKGDWLWRVTWHKGRAYVISYSSKPEPGTPKGDWTAKLLESKDGVDFQLLAKLNVPGRPNEATIRFLENDDAVALVRREGQGKADIAWIGMSKAPYKDWKWESAGMPVGGPNFILLPNGSMIASGRKYGTTTKEVRTFLGHMNRKSVAADVIFPSGGDCSYPGLAWHEGMLWASYYSSHEGKTSIYLAKVRTPQKRASK